MTDSTKATTTPPNSEAAATPYTYRKRPVVVEAFQMTRERRWQNVDWPQWLHEAWNRYRYDLNAVFPHAAFLGIATLEGDMAVSPDDYIIRGVRGELYPCKPDIFEETYELVSEESPPTTASVESEQTKPSQPSETASAAGGPAGGGTSGPPEAGERRYGDPEVVELLTALHKIYDAALDDVPGVRSGPDVDGLLIDIREMAFDALESYGRQPEVPSARRAGAPAPGITHAEPGRTE